NYQLFRKEKDYNRQQSHHRRWRGTANNFGLARATSAHFIKSTSRTGERSRSWIPLETFGRRWRQTARCISQSAKDSTTRGTFIATNQRAASRNCSPVRISRGRT